MTISFIRNCFLLLSFLSLRLRLYFLVIFILMLFTAFVEALTILSIVPFITSLSSVSSSHPLSSASHLGFFQAVPLNHSPFLLAFLVLFSGVLRILTIRSSALISGYSGVQLSSKVITGYYLTCLSYDLSKCLALTTAYTNASVKSIYSLLQLFTSLTISISIFLVLISQQDSSVYITFAFTLFLYYLISFILKSRVSLNSEKIAHYTKVSINTLKDALGFSDIIYFKNLQSNAISAFHRAESIHRIAEANNSYFAIFPRFFIESAVIFVIVILSGLNLNRDDSGHF